MPALSYDDNDDSPDWEYRTFSLGTALNEHQQASHKEK